MQLKKDDDLNERYKNIFNPMHEIADQLAEHTWNMAVQILNKFTPMSGDEAVSALSTLAANFLGMWVTLVKKKIVNKDETGRDMEELMFGIFEGASAMIGKKFEPPQNPEHPHSSGIKGIKYEWK